VNVRPIHLAVAARADRPHAVALGDRRALGHRKRAEVRERHGVAFRRRDRDAEARARHRSGERHGAAGGRDDRRAGCPGDIDAAMLPGGIRVRGVEDERLQDST
jgi:hypothetical protein